MTSCRHAIHACDVKTLCLLDDRLEVAFRLLQPLSQAQPRRTLATGHPIRLAGTTNAPAVRTLADPPIPLDHHSQVSQGMASGSAYSRCLPSSQLLTVARAAKFSSTEAYPSLESDPKRCPLRVGSGHYANRKLSRRAKQAWSEWRTLDWPALEHAVEQLLKKPLIRHAELADHRRQGLLPLRTQSLDQFGALGGDQHIGGATIEFIGRTRH